MDKKTLLLVLFVNDNHISNVKTLQSIYKQDYENILLDICNDCTDSFQNERFLYNLNAGRPENVRQVYFQENPYPMGEFLSQKRFWDKSRADYIVILHSGEYFTSPQALSNCVEYLEEYDDSVAAVITPAERWSDDFKKRVSVYMPSKQNVLSVAGQLSLPENDIRDCMAVYRMAVMRGLDIEIDQEQTHISRKLLPELLERGESITVLPKALCRFSNSSINDVANPVPNTYGNVKLQKINALLKDPPTEMEQETAQWAAPQTKKRNYSLLLYKFSRFQKLKVYAVLDLLLIICAACLTMTGGNILTNVAFVLFAGAVLLAAWTVGMLACNLYYKKYPQRLVSNDGQQ